MVEYVSATEAGILLGRSESYIRKRIGRGDLAATKVDGSWRIARSDLGVLPGTHGTHGTLDGTPVRSSVPPGTHGGTPGMSDGTPVRSDVPLGTPEWRDDLLAQVARLEADKVEASRRERESGQREERSKARIIDLERAATVRESRIADLEHTIGARDSRIADLETTHADELTELRGQVAILEAKVREILEKGQDEALQLANRIADLVDRQQAADARIYELQPVAERVPMLEAAVDEKDAALFERERRLSDMRADIEAIASRPVAGPMFRYLTRGKLRR